MNILFITYSEINSYEEDGLYSGLLREMIERGNKVYTLCPSVSKTEEVSLSMENYIYRIDLGKVTKNKSLIKKGVNYLHTDYKYKKTLKKYFKDTKIDLIICTTPPVTLVSTVSYAKNFFCAKTYLVLKDIFPQNAVDLGMLKKYGLKGIIYRHFRRKEKRLYKISDKIGCMSQANIEYILKQNDINADKVEIFPNSMVIKPLSEKQINLKQQYGIPEDKFTFIYGGNLGKPQGIQDLINGIKHCADLDAVFIIVGNGTEKPRIRERIEKENIGNIYLLNQLEREEYELLCCACDVGVISLDKRFTIPNYPSRILSYMKNAMPVLACTDTVSDIKELIEQGGFGKWCKSGDINTFKILAEWFIENKDSLTDMGLKARAHLEKHFNVKKCADILENFMD